MIQPATITAVGFLIGGAVHVMAFALLAIGAELYGHSYPPLRHVLMAAIDVPIGYIGMRRPRWFLVVLPLYVAQRVVFNGIGVEALVVTLAWLVIAVQWLKSPDDPVAG